MFGLGVYKDPFPDVAKWDNVVSINADIFDNAQSTKYRSGSTYVFVYAYPVIEYNLFGTPVQGSFVVGRDVFRGGYSTNAGTLIVRADDCRTVVTSHPGLPRIGGVLMSPNDPRITGRPIWYNPATGVVITNSP